MNDELKKKVPEHIYRMDLTKELNWKEQFMDDKCKNCDRYEDCLKDKSWDQRGRWVNAEGTAYIECPRNIGVAFREFWKLQKMLDKKKILTKETLDDYQGSESIDSVKMLRLIANMPDAYRGNYYLFGDNSTQKTTMAKALAKKLCYCELHPELIDEFCESFTVEYITMDTLMKLLSKSLDYDVIRDDKTKVNELLDKYRNATWLFLDESFDVSKATYYKTGFLLGELDSFLRDRLENKQKSTVFISNVKVDEIDEEYFGKSIRALISREMEEFLEFNDNITEIKKAEREIPVRRL